jgi:hypothetical protein
MVMACIASCPYGLPFPHFPPVRFGAYDTFVSDRRESIMADLVEFELEDGSSVLIETETVSGRPVTRGRRPTEMNSKADETFEQALRRVGPTSAAIVERLRDLSQQPDEIEIEFGVKVNAEAGAIIAKTSGEANFRIAVRWKRA